MIAGVKELVCPGQKGYSDPGISCPVPKRSNTASVGINQELQIIEQSTTAGEAREGFDPPFLLLEAMGEVDMRVLERT